MISTAVPGAGLPCASVTGKVTVTVSVPLAGAWSLATTAVPGVPTPGTKFISIVCVLLLISAVTLLTPAFVLVRLTVVWPLASVTPEAAMFALLVATKFTRTPATGRPLRDTVARTLLVAVPLASALFVTATRSPAAITAPVTSGVNSTSTVDVLPLAVPPTVTVPVWVLPTSTVALPLLSVTTV